MTKQEIDSLMNEEMQVVMIELKLKSEQFMTKLKNQANQSRIEF